MTELRNPLLLVFISISKSLLLAFLPWYLQQGCWNTKKLTNRNFTQIAGSTSRDEGSGASAAVNPLEPLNVPPDCSNQGRTPRRAVEGALVSPDTPRGAFLQGVPMDNAPQDARG